MLLPLTSRPDMLLQQLDRLAPSIWKSMDDDRRNAFEWDKGVVLPSWACQTNIPVPLDRASPKDQFFLGDVHRQAPGRAKPLVQKGLPMDTPVLLLTPERAAMFYSWRATKLEFRFDPDFARALMDTPVEGEIPPELLLRLPAACIYVEIPLGEIDDWLGFYACLDIPSKNAQPVLRIFGDAGRSWPRSTFTIPVSGGSLSEFMEHRGRDFQEQLAKTVAEGTPIKDPDALLAAERNARASEGKYLAKILSLLLYLCSEEPDLPDDFEVSTVQDKRIGPLRRILPPKAVRCWPIGVRLGSVFRKEIEKHRDIPLSSEAATVIVRPHVRRAHWHTYRTGPKGSRPILKWLSPIIVGAKSAGDALPTVVRPVQENSSDKTCAYQ